MSFRRLLNTLAMLLIWPLASPAAYSQVAPVPRKAQDENNQETYSSKVLKDWKEQQERQGLRKGDGKDAEIDDATGHIEWMRQRMGGELTPDFLQRLFLEAGSERQKYPAQFQQTGPIAMPVVPTGSWTSLGPTSSNKIQNGVTLTKVNSGRLRNILLDTADPETVYILSAGGGLWKSTNFITGAPTTWTPLTDFIGSTAGGSASFGRVTTGVNTEIYLGIGDAFDFNVGGSILKSSNGGSTWGPAISLSPATRVQDVKVDTSQPSDIVLVGTEVGLWRSTDGGTSYSRILDANVNNKRVWSFAQTSAGWLATTYDGAGNGNIYLSLDRGATWTGTITTPPIAVGRMTLGIGLPGDATVYAFAATTSNGNQKDLYRSTDGGLNWTALNINTITPANSNTDQPKMNLMNGQAFYNQMILVDPTDAGRNTVYLGGNLSSARTLDGGATWTILSNWLPRGAFSSLPYVHADFHCAAISNIAATKRVFLGNDGGIFWTSNPAAALPAWDDTKNKGLVTSLIYALISSPYSKTTNTAPNNVCGTDSVLIGLQDNGTHNRLGATSVFDQTAGGDGFGVGWSQAPANTTALYSYVYNDISKAAPPPYDQSLWSAFTTGLGATGTSDNGANYYFVTPIITPPASVDSTGNVFFTYGNGTSKQVFRSNATGWTSIGTLTNGVRAVSHGVGVSPIDQNHVGAAGLGGILSLTVNALNVTPTWVTKNLNTAVPPVGVRTYQGFNANVAWADNNTIYVSSESQNANSIHVVKSSDGGNTWAASETNLPDVPVTKIVVDPTDVNTLYAATWLGVYKSSNAGANWSLFGTGLPQVRVSDIYVHPSAYFIRVSTWGRGVWQMGTAPPALASITTQPANATVTAPASASFSVVASSSQPITYQWRKGGTNLSNVGNISGALTSTLTINPTSATDAANYDCVLTTCAGSTTSNPASLTVNTSAISVGPIAPANPTRTVSTNTTFTTTVTGGVTNTVTWTATGGSIVAATGVWTAPAAAGGPFTITATSTEDGTKSASTTVTVVAAPSIASFVASPTTVASGSSSNLTGTFSNGTGSVDNGVGVVTSTVAKSTGALTATTIFTLTVTNAAGTSVTATATVTVTAISVGPIAPANPTRTVSTNTTFTTTVTGGVTNTVTWTATGGSIVATTGVWTAPAAAGGPFTITATSTEDATKSASTTVTVVAAPSIASFVASPTTVAYGASSNLTGTFSNGTGSVDNGVGVVTSGTAKTTGALTATTTFTLTVTNAAGTSVTATATVTVTAISVGAVAPASPTRTVSTVTNFTSTVTGGVTNAVTWTATGGSIVATTGVWTAPAAAGGPFTITATSTEDGTKSASTAVTVVAAPSIASFVASPTTIASGSSSNLTGTFSNGTGSVDNGVGVVTSTVAKSTGALAATTTFTLTVTNAAGTSVTATVTVTVTGISVGAISPANPTRTVSTNTTFTTTVTGGVTNTVTWTATGGSIVATTGVWTAPAAPGGPFTITATSTEDATKSASTTVTVVAAPSIASFVASPTTITAGSTSNLTGTFSNGTGSVDNGVGVVTSTVAKSTGALTATTIFTLTVTNAAGTSLTSTATVTVVAAPSIASFVASPTTIPTGSSSNLTGTFSNGTGSVDNAVGAVTSGTAKTTGALTATTTFTLTVTNAAGTSVTATATVTVTPPALTTHFSVTGFTSPTTAGVPHTFTVTALDASNAVVTGYTGTVSFTSSDVFPATLPANYTFVAGDAGVHTFSATLFTAGLQSLTATDTVTASIKGTQSGIQVNAAAPASLTINSGNTQSTPICAPFGAGLSVLVKDAYNNAAPGITITFTPPGGGASCSIAPNTVVTNASGIATSAIPTANAVDGAYSVSATATGGTNPSGSFSLTNTAVIPTIAVTPVNPSVCSGSPVTFTATAAGPACDTLTYQWSRNAVPIFGATASTYAFTATPADNGAIYACTVKPLQSSGTNSASSTLTVLAAPTITTQPASQIVYNGQNVSFTVAATGTATLTYQWYRNGLPIGGATSATYSFIAAYPADNGASYYCIVTDGSGCSTPSNTATLTVNPATVEIEPNDSYSNATPLGAPGMCIGRINPANDIDYWRIILPGGRTLTATLTPPAGTSQFIYIYNQAGQIVAQSTQPGGAVNFASVKNTTRFSYYYYVVIRSPFGVFNTNDYQLQVNW